MTNAFQRTAFQHPGFQGGGAVSVPHPGAGSVTGPAGRKKRRRVLLELDGHTFEVDNEAEARELLAQAREAAVEQAQVLAEEALTKSVKAKRPAAKAKALEVPIPQLRIVDVAEELAQQIQAQVDAANSAIAQIYQQAMVDATQALALRLQQDEDDAIIMLMIHHD